MALNEAEAENRLSHDSFVLSLIGEQTRLFSYITMLIGDVNEANNILQETNIVIWRKADKFTDGTSFSMWARKIAYFCTLSYIRDKKRDKHIFDEEIVHQLAARPITADEDERRVALRHCLSTLTERSLELLRQRYWPGQSISVMASQRGRTEGAIKMALMRLRQSLAQCIQQKMEGLE